MTYVRPRVHNIADAPTGWWERTESRRPTYIGRSEEYARDCGMSVPIWANPFRVPTSGTREKVVELYEAWTRRRLTSLLRHAKDFPHGDDLRRAILALSDRDLYCHCAPKPCHGDALVRVFADLAGLT